MLMLAGLWDALVIFLEGGNWTPHRWRRGIRRPEQKGRPDLAARARDMPNLLPPPGRTLPTFDSLPGQPVGPLRRHSCDGEYRYWRSPTTRPQP